MARPEAPQIIYDILKERYSTMLTRPETIQVKSRILFSQSERIVDTYGEDFDASMMLAAGNGRLGMGYGKVTYKITPPVEVTGPDGKSVDVSVREILGLAPGYKTKREGIQILLPAIIDSILYTFKANGAYDWKEEKINKLSELKEASSVLDYLEELLKAKLNQ